MTDTGTTTAIDPPGRIAWAIVTHNSRPDLEAFFEGQLEAARALRQPVIVVDNASTDGGPELVSTLLDPERGERLVELGRNAGYAAAVNAALAAAPGVDLLLLNPDVEVKNARATEELARALDEHPRAGVVAPKLVDSDGRAQSTARRFPTPFSILGGTGLGRRVPHLRRANERYLSIPAGDSPSKVDWAIGAALLIRRKASDEVGSWDERFFLYVEDVDFCRRLARAGWEVVYVPQVALHHRHVRASTQPGISAMRSPVRRSHIRGLLRLWRKHPALLAGAGAAGPRPPADCVTRRTE